MAPALGGDGTLSSAGAEGEVRGDGGGAGNTAERLSPEASVIDELPGPSGNVVACSTNLVGGEPGRQRRRRAHGTKHRLGGRRRGRPSRWNGGSRRRCRRRHQASYARRGVLHASRCVREVRPRHCMTCRQEGAWGWRVRGRVRGRAQHHQPSLREGSFGGGGGGTAWPPVRPHRVASWTPPCAPAPNSTSAGGGGGAGRLAEGRVARSARAVRAWVWRGRCEGAIEERGSVGAGGRGSMRARCRERAVSSQNALRREEPGRLLPSAGCALSEAEQKDPMCFVTVMPPPRSPRRDGAAAEPTDGRDGFSVHIWLPQARGAGAIARRRRRNNGRMENRRQQWTVHRPVGGSREGRWRSPACSALAQPACGRGQARENGSERRSVQRGWRQARR